MKPIFFSVHNPEPDRAKELGRASAISTTLAHVLVERGIDSSDAAKNFLEPRLADLTRPDRMLGRDVAADRVARAIQAKERVVVFGDYDVDGTTSAAIIADVIEALGGNVTAMLASRFDGGYGFSDAGLSRALSFAPSLIITCDCGSSDHARIESAVKQGVDVIVVDHHLVPEAPLPALAFLNPHQPACGFAYKNLTSAGLAFFLGAAIRAKLGATLDMRAWLDLVALGTVADVAPLDGDNRRLVRAGLAALSSPNARPGIRALCELAKLKPGVPLSAQDIGFRLGPRLNAAGRLGDPTITLELLRSRDMAHARGLAAAIEAKNTERKLVEKNITDVAIAQIRALYGEAPKHGIVADGQGWNRGVVGISAARLVDHFHVPAVTIAVEDGVGHASCRAPEGFRLHDALSSCGDLFIVFGGHQAAAGFSIREEHIASFKERFAAASESGLHAVNREREKRVDIVIDGVEFPFPKAAELLLLEPMGAGNPEPVFGLENVVVDRASIVGDGHLKLEVRVGNGRLSAFGYGLGAKRPKAGSRVHIAGSLQPDNWRGGDNIEMRLRDIFEA